MFIKRKTRAGKVCAYRMGVSFETWVTHKKKLTSRRKTLSVVKQLSLDITPFYDEHCPMSDANSSSIILSTRPS